MSVCNRNYRLNNLLSFGSIILKKLLEFFALHGIASRKGGKRRFLCDSLRNQNVFPVNKLACTVTDTVLAITCTKYSCRKNKD